LLTEEVLLGAATGLIDGVDFNELEALDELPTWLLVLLSQLELPLLLPLRLEHLLLLLLLLLLQLLLLLLLLLLLVISLEGFCGILGFSLATGGFRTSTDGLGVPFKIAPLEAPVT